MNNTDRITNWINSILQEVSKLKADEGIEILRACGKDCSKASVLLEGAIEIHDKYSDTDDPDIFFKAFKEKYYNTSWFEK